MFFLRCNHPESHDTIISDFQKIASDESNGQIFKQSDFPFVFLYVVLFFYRSHDMILTRLLDGNRTPIDFEATF